MEGWLVSGKRDKGKFCINQKAAVFLQQHKTEENIMRAMGIDIGTTTISIILLEGKSGELLGSRTIPHQAFIEGMHSFNRVQNPEKLYRLTMEGASELAAKYGKPDSIGFTGQMHGVLYVNKEGKAVTPLYTWQDESGNEKMDGGSTYAEVLRKKVGTAATGYGMTTHFFLCHNNEIPEDAAWMTTISDYIAMRFCNRRRPILAGDMAASWGCFDLENREFLKEKLEAAGVRTDCLPELCKGHEIIGKSVAGGLEGIPVMVSLGDNQASFIGSVRNLRDTVLLNIGTGSQVSYGTGTFYGTEGSIELRPCTKDSYILAGSSLCGGRAYAMLEQFYRQISEMSGKNPAENSLYEIMEKQARAYMEKAGLDSAWKIRTTFSGTRTDPTERGSISNIGIENFTPGSMTVGMLWGILKELYGMYQEMCQMTGDKAINLVGSGNGIRRNSLMQELAEKMFGMKLSIPKCQEEAAFGAALYSLVSAELVESLQQVQSIIQYI